MYGIADLANLVVYLYSLSIQFHDHDFIRLREIDIFAMVVILSNIFLQIELGWERRPFSFLWLITCKLSITLYLLNIHKWMT